MGPLSRLVNSAHEFCDPPTRKLITVVDDSLGEHAALAENGASVEGGALVENAAPTNDPIADFPVTIEAVLMPSLVPDQTVTGSYPPLS